MKSTLFKALRLAVILTLPCVLGGCAVLKVLGALSRGSDGFNKSDGERTGVWFKCGECNGTGFKGIITCGGCGGSGRR